MPNTRRSSAAISTKSSSMVNAASPPPLQGRSAVAFLAAVRALRDLNPANTVWHRRDYLFAALLLVMCYAGYEHLTVHSVTATRERSPASGHRRSFAIDKARVDKAIRRAIQNSVSTGNSDTSTSAVELSAYTWPDNFISEMIQDESFEMAANEVAEEQGVQGPGKLEEVLNEAGREASARLGSRFPIVMTERSNH